MVSLALPLLALLSAVAAPVRQGEEDLREWLREIDRGRRVLDADAYNDLRRLLDHSVETVPAGASVEHEEGEPVHPLDDVLLDLAALNLEPRRRSRADDEPVNPLDQKVREAALRRLVMRGDGAGGEEVVRWLARSVLFNGRESVGRRIAAVRALGERRQPPVVEPLLAAAATKKPAEVREAALTAVCGWAQPAVTDFLLSNASLGEDEGEVPLRVLQDHLERVQGELSEPDQARVLERAGPHLTAEAWREAARALGLVRTLPTQACYPVLIDALEAWAARRGERTESRRLESDLARELERRSGRALGPHPERWRNWWNLVQEGKVAPPPDPDEDVERTEATFFSLRPSSKRVTFVIDRSGSMSARFGEAGGRSRYEEAVEQTLNYLLVSGETTEFNVLLFSNETLRYKSRLQTATERNRDALQRWLLYNGPEGGTHLREAVESALELDRRGSPDLGRLDSDTIVVLCDGATYDGPGWVVPILERINDRAQVVFHCVQLGPEGDGTLELLARESGGDYIQVLR